MNEMLVIPSTTGLGRYLGEMIKSGIPLFDTALHKLDGSVLIRPQYNSFINYIQKVYENRDITSNVQKVGNLTDNNSVLSNFVKDSNYAILPEKFNPSNSSWEIVLKINMTDISAYSGILDGDVGLGCVELLINKGLLNYWVSYNGSASISGLAGASGSFTFVNNKEYWIKLVFTGTTYFAYCSEDGINYITNISVNSTQVVHQGESLRLGINYYGTSASLPMQGSIDLKESYINIGGKRWWTGTCSRDFCSEDEWQKSIYTNGSCGKFVYDVINETVQLPKINDSNDVKQFKNLQPYIYIVVK